MSILRSLAIAVVRKLLPEAVSDPGASLALRSDTQLTPRFDRRSVDCFPIDRRPQSLYAPPAPRRRRRIVVVEETTWRS